MHLTILHLIAPNLELESKNMSFATCRAINDLPIKPLLSYFVELFAEL